MKGHCCHNNVVKLLKFYKSNHKARVMFCISLIVCQNYCYLHNYWSCSYSYCYWCKYPLYFHYLKCYLTGLRGNVPERRLLLNLTEHYTCTLRCEQANIWRLVANSLVKHPRRGLLLTMLCKSSYFQLQFTSPVEEPLRSSGISVIRHRNH